MMRIHKIISYVLKTIMCYIWDDQNIRITLSLMHIA